MMRRYEYCSKNPPRQLGSAAILGLGLSVLVLLSSLAFAVASDMSGDEQSADNIEAQTQREQRRRRRLETINVNRTTAEAAVLKLVGPNITTRNATLYSSSTVCLGTFEVDNVGDEIVWPNASYPRSGIILSTGSADTIVGPNDAKGTTADPDEADEGTPDPNPVFNMGNADDDGGGGIFFDACTLEFEFLCTGSSENEPTSFSYVFGSEDYFEFIDVENDQFRFLLNGVNIALLPNGDAVEIDAINEEDNPELFNKNAANEDDDVFEPLYNIEADGFTTVLTASGTCNATMNGGWNKMKLVIADEFDRGYDSWLLLGASSFVVGAPPSPSPSQMPSFAPSFAPTPVSTGTLTMRRTAPPSTMPSSEPTPDIGGDGEGVGAGQPTLQPSTIEVTGRNVVCPCRHDEE